ncbi:MAG: hypothetical protein U0271_22080 [Polyangiaceae bacterium]
MRGWLDETKAARTSATDASVYRQQHEGIAKSDAERAAADEELRRLERERKRLERARRVLPLFGRLREAEARRRETEDAILLPQSAREERLRAEAELEETAAELATIEARRTELERERAALGHRALTFSVDDAIATLSERIGEVKDAARRRAVLQAERASLAPRLTTPSSGAIVDAAAETALLALLRRRDETAREAARAEEDAALLEAELEVVTRSPTQESGDARRDEDTSTLKSHLAEAERALHGRDRVEELARKATELCAAAAALHATLGSPAKDLADRVVMPAAERAELARPSKRRCARGPHARSRRARSTPRRARARTRAAPRSRPRLHRGRALPPRGLQRACRPRRIQGRRHRAPHRGRRRRRSRSRYAAPRRRAHRAWTAREQQLKLKPLRARAALEAKLDLESSREPCRADRLTHASREAGAPIFVLGEDAPDARARAVRASVTWLEQRDSWAQAAALAAAAIAQHRAALESALTAAAALHAAWRAPRERA